MNNIELDNLAKAKATDIIYWCHKSTEERDKNPNFVTDSIKAVIIEVQKTIIDKGKEWLRDKIMIPYEGKTINGESEAEDYIKWLEEREKLANKFIESFESALTLSFNNNDDFIVSDSYNKW